MIRTYGFTYKKIAFPCGEPHIIVSLDNICALGGYKGGLKIVFEFEKADEILDLLLICNAIKHMDYKLDELVIPYIPFGRQDRVCNDGEAFSLEVFANLLNSLNLNYITTDDPHSDVTPALIKNLHVFHQHEMLKPIFNGKKNFYLISPDGGALKKIYKLAAEVDCLNVIECSKQRNVKNGEIIGVNVHCLDLEETDCYIVDDICDGGRTFIEIAKVLKTKNAGKIVLAVSHGFFTKGLDVFDGLIDEIYTPEGKIK